MSKTNSIFLWNLIIFGIFWFKFHLFWRKCFGHLLSRLLLFWKFLGRKFQFLCVFFVNWKIDFSWWFWSFEKNYWTKIWTFLTKIPQKILKHWSLLKFVITIILIEIIKFGCVVYIRSRKCTKSLQMWDTVFREGHRNVIMYRSVSIHTCNPYQIIILIIWRPSWCF